jgi:hypothetical protein
MLKKINIENDSIQKLNGTVIAKAPPTTLIVCNKARATKSSAKTFFIVKEYISVSKKYIIKETVAFKLRKKVESKNPEIISTNRI